jgi:hypothetical protein
VRGLFCVKKSDQMRTRIAQAKTPYLFAYAVFLTREACLLTPLLAASGRFVAQHQEMLAA